MDIPADSSQPVNIYHSSVRDYVLEASNCSLFEGQCITPVHSLLARSSLSLMIRCIPERSTGLLDALLELKRHCPAVQSHDPQTLMHSLAFIVEPLQPLLVLKGLLLIRGYCSSELQYWVETRGGRAWLQTQGGLDWLRTRCGLDWLQTRGDYVWLWVETQGGQDWLQTQGGQDWLRTQGGLDWLQTAAMRWLQTRGGLDWLQTPSCWEWLQTQGGSVWLRTLGSSIWLQTKGCWNWLQTSGGQRWLHTEGGWDWLHSQGGCNWLQTQGGQESGWWWVNTQAGRDWLQRRGGDESDWSWIKSLHVGRAEISSDSEETSDGLCLQPHSQQARNKGDCLQPDPKQEFLQTWGGEQWLQSEEGREWLQGQSGQEWLQTSHGQAWQLTQAGSIWVQMEEFSSTVEAVSQFMIIPEVSSFPTFQAIQQFKNLPDFLMFPAFLALTAKSLRTDAPSQCHGIEIIEAFENFMSFGNKAWGRNSLTSDTLSYACKNWAMHLSQAPSPWDDALIHVFKVFWDDHLLAWLERQWCLKGLGILPSCTFRRTEACKVGTPPSSLRVVVILILNLSISS